MSNIYAEIKAHQSFDTVAELDKAVRAFLYRFKHELTPSAVAVLKYVWRHSCKVVGVSFAKIAYITAGVTVSRRTVIRAINQLEEYGIIKRVPTVRPNGKRGVNLLVIHPVEGTDLPDVSPQADTANVTAPKADKPNDGAANEVPAGGETLNKHSLLCKNKKIRNNYEVPRPFVAAVQPFASVADMWRRTVIAHKASGLSAPLKAVVHTAVGAFKAAVSAWRAGRVRKGLAAYYYGTLAAMLAVERRREVGEELAAEAATAGGEYRGGYDWVHGERVAGAAD